MVVCCYFDTPVWELALGLYNSIFYIYKRFASHNVKVILNYLKLCSVYNLDCDNEAKNRRYGLTV